MRKILIIFLVVIVFLTGCDISTLWENKTPDTETPATDTPETETPKTDIEKFMEENPDLPMSETVTLGDRLHKEDVAYIQYGMTWFGLFGAAPLDTTYDVDGFFEYVIEKNLDKVMVTNIEGDDAYDKIMDDSWELIRKGEIYVFIIFCDSKGYTVGTMSIYPDNAFVYCGHDTYIDYVSVGKSEVDVNTFYEAMLEGTYWRKWEK